MLVKDIKNITLEEAMEFYKLTGMTFVIKDEKLKDYNKKKKKLENKKKK